MKITEDKLLLISLILTIAGIILLWFVRDTLSVPISHDAFLEAREVRIVLEGDIKNVQTYDWGSRFVLSTSCEIPVIISEFVVEGPAIVHGSKRFYQGRPEVSADKVIMK